MYDAFKRFSFLTELLISLERCDTFTKLPSEKYEDDKLYKKKIYLFLCFF